jgi:hypothetical protein
MATFVVQNASIKAKYRITCRYSLDKLSCFMIYSKLLGDGGAGRIAANLDRVHLTARARVAG